MKLDAHESDFNTEFICNATDFLFAQQLLKGPWGALPHFYMQMALHLGSSAGMLGTHLCKSDYARMYTHTHIGFFKGTPCSCCDGYVRKRQTNAQQCLMKCLKKKDWGNCMMLVPRSSNITRHLFCTPILGARRFVTTTFVKPEKHFS